MVVQGQLVDSSVEWEDQQPGAFWFLDSSDGRVDAALGFMCPCGCGNTGCLPLYRSESQEPVQRPAWLWDGSKEMPTLQPSIQRIGGCAWHGFLEQGRWRSV